MTLVQIPVSVGELVDRLTILELKQQHLTGDALVHVNREYQLLLVAFASVAPLVPAQLREQLRAVNTELWHVEEAIRACDARGEFGTQFVALAQQVYRRNDQRAALKRAINKLSGSALVEQKSYST